MKTISTGNKNYEVSIKVSDKYEYFSDYRKIDSKGTTPLGYLSVALSTCVNMVTNLYFENTHFKDVNIKVECLINEKTEITLNIYVNQVIDDKEKEKIVKYVTKNCPIYNMLSKDLKIEKIVHSM